MEQWLPAIEEVIELNDDNSSATGANPVPAQSTQREEMIAKAGEDSTVI